MTVYIAIQQIEGNQPTKFMKLARRMTAKEIHAYCGKRLPLDEKWMADNGYRNVSGWATSPIMDVRVGKDKMVLLLKTANSVYQAIPEFT